ncbi:pilus assembly protein TadG-related protein [Streptomyces sp. NPDC088725]|uniref:pilus assembly protein TadG-related protein n=1 Tax=Streptomyces sp. NPDC088725 TaxID=3365873 RepID=UPI0038172CE1
MIALGSHETGQAVPIYIMMVAALLFLALAFFAVGQAGATRNGAQSAADAAALAAARDSRDMFGDGLLEHLLDPAFLDDVFNGDPIGANGCAAAGYFAQLNKANVDRCDWAAGGRWGFTVHVVTQQPMGDTILPGVGSQPGRAQATAVVEPRCGFKPAEDGEAKPPAGDGAPVGQADGDVVSPGELQCDGKKWKIDPEELDLLPDMADLFSVRLAED